MKALWLTAPFALIGSAWGNVSDRAAEALALTPQMATADLCVIERTSTADGNAIDLIYAKDGKMTRSQSWSVDEDGGAQLVEQRDYAWSGNELTITSSLRRGARRLRFDDRGLLLEYTSEDTNEHARLTWDVKKIEHPSLLYRPHNRDIYTFDLPWQLAYTGSVAVDSDGKKPLTAVYERHGTLQYETCHIDGQGRETQCGDQLPIWFKWSGSELVAEIRRTERMTYRYDRAHRVIRIEDFTTDIASRREMVVSIRHIEHRCAVDKIE
jgi:hypothetical protein